MAALQEVNDLLFGPVGRAPRPRSRDEALVAAFRREERVEEARASDDVARQRHGGVVGIVFRRDQQRRNANVLKERTATALFVVIRRVEEAMKGRSGGVVKRDDGPRAANAVDIK